MPSVIFTHYNSFNTSRTLPWVVLHIEILKFVYALDVYKNHLRAQQKSILLTLEALSLSLPAEKNEPPADP